MGLFVVRAMVTSKLLMLQNYILAKDSNYLKLVPQIKKGSERKRNFGRE